MRILWLCEIVCQQLPLTLNSKLFTLSPFGIAERTNLNSVLLGLGGRSCLILKVFINISNIYLRDLSKIQHKTLTNFCTCTIHCAMHIDFLHTPEHYVTDYARLQNFINQTASLFILNGNVGGWHMSIFNFKYHCAEMVNNGAETVEDTTTSF